MNDRTPFADLMWTHRHGFRFDPKDPPTPPEPPTPEKGKAKDEPKTLTLTQDELDAKIEAAATKVRDEHAEAERKRKEEAERKELEAKGEEKTLREKAEAERDEARLHARRLEIRGDLTDYLAEKHPDYVKCAKYVLPLLAFDLKTDAESLRKQMKEVADQYVKDNPRAVGAGAPPSPGRGNLPKGTVEPKDGANKPPPRAPYMKQI